MEIPVLQIDAFATEPFKGNPAAVCLLNEAKPAAWMQNVAAEMNLAETAFVVPRQAGDGFDLRWFTPAVEVPLCGHATLASAHALWETERLSTAQEARFHTLSGVLTARRAQGVIEMDFPAIFTRPAALPPLIRKALNVTPRAVQVSWRSDGTDGNYLLELDAEKTVRDLQPDFSRLRQFTNAGVIVTARGDESPYDFVSRYFACYVGIDEDPVTGMAHCMLTPYWAEQLGQTELKAYQASARGGAVNVRLNGDRVALGGSAVTVLRGSLLC